MLLIINSTSVFTLNKTGLQFVSSYLLKKTMEFNNALEFIANKR